MHSFYWRSSKPREFSRCDGSSLEFRGQSGCILSLSGFSTTPTDIPAHEQVNGGKILTGEDLRGYQEMLRAKLDELGFGNYPKSLAFNIAINHALEDFLPRKH